LQLTNNKVQIANKVMYCIFFINNGWLRKVETEQINRR
jgi:hypothetical protein